jgi:hypothetical protein
MGEAGIATVVGDEPLTKRQDVNAGRDARSKTPHTVNKDRFGIFIFAPRVYWRTNSMSW